MDSSDESLGVDLTKQTNVHGTSDDDTAVEFVCDDFASSQGSHSENVKLIPTTLSEKKNTTGWLIALTCISAIGGALFGYDTGVVSGAMILIDERFDLDHYWHEMIVSITVAAAAVSALASGVLNDWFGRKKVMLLAAVVFTVGAVIMGIANSKEVLLVGRMIVGFGIGFASMTVPVYISETAPSNIRGRLIVVNNLFITGGQFVATVIDGLFSINQEFAKKNGWRFMLSLGGVPSVVMFIGLLFMPESPRWLVFHNKEDKAREVFAKTRRPEEIEEELQDIKEEHRRLMKEKMSVFAFISRVFHTRSVMLAIVVGCGLQIFQQISGINTVMYYSASIIQMFGYNDQQAIWFSILPAFANFTFTAVGLYFVERVGRRKLLIVSLVGVVFWFGVLSMSFFLSNQHSPATVPLYIGAQCDFKNCGTCVANSKCGFCAVEVDDGKYSNGTCTKGDDDNSDFRFNDTICGTAFDYRDYINNSANDDGGNRQWYFKYCPDNRFAALALVALFMYLVFFAPGMGPLPWTINSEIYPMWARSNAVALATTCNWIFNLLVSVTFLTLIDAVTQPITFLFYAIFAFAGLLFVIFLVPETKGVSLETVERLFERPHFMNWCTAKRDRRNSVSTKLINDRNTEE